MRNTGKVFAMGLAKRLRRGSRSVCGEAREVFAARLAKCLRRGWQSPPLSFLLLFLSFFISSCDALPEKLAVLQGNFYYAAKRYDDAVFSYYRALEKNETGEYAEFGLAAVYDALGEDDAALQRLARAAERSAERGDINKDLAFRIAFNRGVLEYHTEDFERALLSFKQALLLNGKSIDAKKNLELCLRALRDSGETGKQDGTQNKQRKADGGNGDAEKTAETPAAPVIFAYIREKEQERWSGGEWQEEENGGGEPDY